MRGGGGEGGGSYLRAGKPDRLQAHQKQLLVLRVEARPLSHDPPDDRACVIEGAGPIRRSWMKVRLRVKVPVHTHTHTHTPAERPTEESAPGGDGVGALRLAMGTDGIGEGARFSGEGVVSSAANSSDAGGLAAIVTEG